MGEHISDTPYPAARLAEIEQASNLPIDDAYWHVYAPCDMSWLLARVAALQADNDELQQTFELMHDANQRGIKLWQLAHPGNDLVWPDQADMTRWMVERIQTLTAALRRSWQEFEDILAWEVEERCAMRPQELRSIKEVKQMITTALADGR